MRKALYALFPLLMLVAGPLLAQDNAIIPGGGLVTSMPSTAVWKVTATAPNSKPITLYCEEWKGTEAKLRMKRCYQRIRFGQDELVFYYRYAWLDSWTYTVSRAETAKETAAHRIGDNRSRKRRQQRASVSRLEALTLRRAVAPAFPNRLRARRRCPLLSAGNPVTVTSQDSILGTSVQHRKRIYPL
jgi:hypothetical protein